GLAVEVEDRDGFLRAARLLGQGQGDLSPQPWYEFARRRRIRGQQLLEDRQRLGKLIDPLEEVSSLHRQDELPRAVLDGPEEQGLRLVEIAQRLTAARRQRRHGGGRDLRGRFVDQRCRFVAFVSQREFAHEGDPGIGRVRVQLDGPPRRGFGLLVV